MTILTKLTVNVALAGSVDTTPPVLSSISAKAVGSGGWSGSVETDEANGTLYWIVTANASENEATVKAGNSRTVTATGAQALSGSGLSPSTTYYLHTLQQDAAGNDSEALSSSGFTTSSLESGSGTVDIQILRRGALEAAPEGVFFRANVSDSSVTQAGNRSDYDPSTHLCTYIWSFGDPGRQSDKVENVLAAHNDLNEGRGKEVGHTFQSAGTYTVTCTVYGPNGLIGSDSTSITTGDPDTVFAGDKTILVNASGQADAAYPDATVVSSHAAARTEMNSRAQACRVLFKRGETFAASNSLLGFAATNPNFYLGAYGSGDDPIINRTGGDFVVTGTGFTGDFVITDLQLNGGWNPLNETGTESEFIRLYTYDTPRMHVINNCIIKGAHLGVYLPGSGAGAGKVASTHICNTSITDWASYGVFSFGGQDEAVSIEGCNIARNGLAWEGGSGSFSVGNSQGSVRIQRRMRVNIRVCDMFSKCSWTVSGGIPGQQPPLRFNTYGVSGHYSHVDRCSFEGGADVISYDNDQGDGVATVNSVIERSIMVAGPITERMVRFEGTGQTVRNCIMVVPNAPRFRNWESMFEWQSNTPANQDPVNLHNNTLINYLDDTNRNGEDLTRFTAGPTSNYTDINQENNVIWTPNATGQGLTDPQLTSVDMVTVGGEWTPRYIGHIWSGQQTLNTTYASPTGFMKDFRPDTGSPLIDDATGLVPYDDFYGTVRSAADRGAVEQ